ncbi:hypothetical protein M2317_001472 [Microbacterium sp. ZKA21]|uniref:hypothetical protein n=1 Tax=Microbacterium sp. ZKA21 TaxID=3381694 RepID=UPI003D246C5F
MTTREPFGGRTTITARALQQFAVGVVSDAADVRADRVHVDLGDQHGALRVSVTVPVLLGRSEDLVRRGTGIRDRVIASLGDDAGRRVGVVDVRFSGVVRVDRRVQ